MIKTLFLSTGALSFITFAIVRSDQLALFAGDWFAPFFVIAGGVFMAFSVSGHRENALVARLEAFRTGCIFFGVIGTLLGVIMMIANVDDPKAVGPALALALLTLLWAAVFNYIAKLVIVSKSADD